ncbi:protoporphyrinogen oxidase [Paenibacillus curdlanolyticus YK9]|uniref:Coproporphyrinogen III oxidase n=1 Tax=Paenibacillus curdlanolyticus YK9 TaxID=717606 RepID=E0I5X3_9BACL|nr:protoporphyrinogen oxidase [Paenibacillus curdlanolyticus]EFM12365.1 protoporphyrinogen oxidase [Paenibacillus curdlanolyticus YK9]
MKTIAIIGGGITGLSTAYYLQKQINERKLDATIVLIEASEQLGGKIATLPAGPFMMETGADSIVARKSNMTPLLDELGLQDEIVYNATGRSYIHVDGELKLIPEEAVFGIPLSLESLAGSTLLSAEGKVDALRDFYTPNTTFTKDDSIGDFLSFFLGKELVEKQISPVLSGVYSGELHELTLASTLPYLLDYKNEHGSIIQGLAANRAKFKGKGDKKFYSFANGLSALIDRMEERIPSVDIRKGTKAERIEKAEGSSYSIRLMNGETIQADSIVLGTLHPVAQSLLQSPMLDEEFDQMRNSSLTSVYIAFDIADDELPLDGTGFIAAENSSLICNACTWTSRKWTHTSKTSQLLVRLFYKSTKPAFEKLRNGSEQELLKTALSDVKAAMGIVAEPLHYVVTKWDDTMPNYHIRHHAIVRALETKMAEQFPRIRLAGCSYYGVGIPDCVANGEQIAVDLAEWLAGESE